ncbi:MAG: hypothetical protein K1Y02_23450 [Candidatus Hydrogenedentes bacterium]|nr:hypothetical protein [Candidatus Hydrogenedentota bacterium]
MSAILGINRLQDTQLFKRLQSLESDSPEGQIAKQMTGVLPSLCDKAMARMKAMPGLHPQFTLHDATHLLRVTEIAGMVLGKTVDSLSSVEIALLILAAHYHDQGMVLDRDAFEDLVASDEYKLHCEQWRIEHPNFRETEVHLADQNLSADERTRLAAKIADLLQAMTADFVRLRHADFSAEYIRGHLGKEVQLEVYGVNISDMLANICLSHVMEPKAVKSEANLPIDGRFGRIRVNARFLALVLRLADILDFDRERTPDAIYRTIHFTSPVSISEWEKHRSVQGWVINSGQIQFHMSFDHPIYQKTASLFMDSIDVELLNAWETVRTFPAADGIADVYTLSLPLRADRSKMGPKDNAYVWHDLEFSLSRDEVVKLLMTENLYDRPNLCIRELLQNSLDALRYRSALRRADGATLTNAIVEFEHGVDSDGYEFLQCRDNGIGMDEEIITQFLTKVGRSYYRSPIFERERVRFRMHGVDFDPCSQFGIGFMSCFMLADRILITTKRDYGLARGHGKGIDVEISGLAGTIVIKERLGETPVGSTVRLAMRKRPAWFDELEDKVHLLSVIEGITIAAEFPVAAKCSIPEIAGEIRIAPEIAECWRRWAKSHGVREIVLSQSFRDFHDDLQGKVQEVFVCSARGKLCLSDSRARWRPPNKREEHSTFVFGGAKIDSRGLMHGGRVSLDGILVGGYPGRSEPRTDLGHYSVPVHSSSPFIMDVRGALKPEITPARTPPIRSFRRSVGWWRLQGLVDKATGRIWEQVLQRPEIVDSPLLFWQLVAIYGFWPLQLRADVVWDRVTVPLLDGRKIGSWLKLSELDGISTCEESEEYLSLWTKTGHRIGFDQRILKWSRARFNALESKLRSLVLSSCLVKVNARQIVFIPQAPNAPFDTLDERRLKSEHGSSVLALPYSTKESRTICATNLVETVNSGHPLVQLALKSDLSANTSEVAEFARFACFCLSDTRTHISLENHKVSNWMASLGRSYMRVNWDRYGEDLAAPYTVVYMNAGRIRTRVIGHSDFEAWARVRRVRD